MIEKPTKEKGTAIIRTFEDCELTKLIKSYNVTWSSSNWHIIQPIKFHRKFSWNIKKMFSHPKIFLSTIRRFIKGLSIKEKRTRKQIEEEIEVFVFEVNKNG